VAGISGETDREARGQLGEPSSSLLETAERDMVVAQRVEAIELNLRKRGKKKYFITIA
jgi:hypothetical protein